MIIKNSRRKYFNRPDGTREFIGREVRYAEKEAFIEAKDLKENIGHEDLINHLEKKEQEKVEEESE